MRKTITLSLGLMATVLAGCGPTDATINSSVKQKLAADDTVKSAAIEATTQKKVVTLTGTVDSQDTKDRAATDARQTDGVSDVVNQLTVASFGGGPRGPGAGGYGPGNMPNGGPNGSGNGAGGIDNGGGQGSGGSGMSGGGGQGSGGAGMRNGGGQGSGGAGMRNGEEMGSGGSGMHHNGSMGTRNMGHNGGQSSGDSTPPPPPKKPE